MTLISGGRLINPQSSDLDIAFEGSRIVRIGKIDPRDGVYERVIDARGKTVVPGLVDVHVHFRDPGLTYKEDIISGAAAAARGGFTSVVCMANTKPPVDNAETLAEVLAKAAEAAIRVYTVAALSRGMGGRELTDMAGLKKLGALGFSDDGIPIRDSAFLQKALLAARELDVPISLHEEDPSLIGVPGINEGKVSAAMGMTGAPAVSESSLVARDCMLALATGARVHIQHLSCAESLELVRLAKRLGAGSTARLTAEVTPQHFSLTEDAILSQGTLAKLNPPLRTERDRRALIEGLKDGTIDMIATDHAPHGAEEKARPFAEAPSGLIGLETALALGITNLVLPGYLSLDELIGKMTAAPAALYGLEAGFLAEGGPADITIIDDRERWTVSGFVSKSSNSPFVGQTLTGKVKYTICAGKIVYRDGEA
ncbi:dihydroorotase [Treponema primitia]|uniref:dihydroorotase n=1 Tax=Treponema primitia TaxID=88058 RepID=UPI00397EF837